MPNDPPEMSVTLTIAGSDCSAGAGIQADLKTFAACGVYGLTALTCVVAEVPGHVASIEPVTPEMLRQQLEILTKTFAIGAIKTGMLYAADYVDSTAEVLGNYRQDHPGVKIVVDPVMIASSGDALSRDRESFLDAIVHRLFPITDIITPNREEAAVLLGREPGPTEDPGEVAVELRRRYRTAILLKGGHGGGAEATDVLAWDGGVETFTAARIGDADLHGTGCTLSAALTAYLARGFSLPEAAERAKEFVTSAIRHRHAWEKDVLALNHRHS